MTARGWRIWLVALGCAMLASLALFVLNPRARRTHEPPEDTAGRALWLATHPADWHTAALLSHQALESFLPQRVALWRAAHEHAMHLAPRRPHATAAFVRGGLFHWYELGESDRRAVIAAAEPLLADPDVFRDLHVPLWQLTRDFALLRRAAPDELSLLQLSDLAVTNGLFAEYRALREDVRRMRMMAVSERGASMPQTDLLRLIPHRLDAGDLPLVQRVLDELHRRPLDTNPGRADAMDALIDFATRRDLKPLDGIAYVVNDPTAASEPARARLATALGLRDRAREIRIGSTLGPSAWAEDPRQWHSQCGTDICGVAWTQLDVDAPRTVRAELAMVQTDEVPPYVELYLNDRLVGEGDVRTTRSFTFDAPSGGHRFEVRLVNPLTRNKLQRRVRLSSLS